MHRPRKETAVGGVSVFVEELAAFKYQIKIYELIWASLKRVGMIDMEQEQRKKWQKVIHEVVEVTQGLENLKARASGV